MIDITILRKDGITEIIKDADMVGECVPEENSYRYWKNGEIFKISLCDIEKIDTSIHSCGGCPSIRKKISK
jgi:hypothetical protein